MASPKIEKPVNIDAKIAMIDQEIAKRQVPAGVVRFYKENGTYIEGELSQKWTYEPLDKNKKSYLWNTIDKNDASLAFIPKGTVLAVANGNFKGFNLAGDAYFETVGKEKIELNKPLVILVKGSVVAQQNDGDTSITASQNIKLGLAFGELTSGANVHNGSTLTHVYAKGAVKSDSQIRADWTIQASTFYLKQGDSVALAKFSGGAIKYVAEKDWASFSPPTFVATTTNSGAAGESPSIKSPLSAYDLTGITPLAASPACTKSTITFSEAASSNPATDNALVCAMSKPNAAILSK